MKIPGLAFIIVPIICWLLYIYMDNIIIYYSDIINYYKEDPSRFITKFIASYLMCLIVELLFFHKECNTFEEWCNKSVFMFPFMIIYKILKYINNKLTVNI